MDWNKLGLVTLSIAAGSSLASAVANFVVGQSTYGFVFSLNTILLGVAVAVKYFGKPKVVTN